MIYKSFTSLKAFFSLFVCLLLLFSIAGAPLLFANTVYPFTQESVLVQEVRSVFPEVLFTSFLDAQRLADMARPYWVPTEEEHKMMLSYLPPESILLNNDILLYYGHPMSRNMGILGRYSPEQLRDMMAELAIEYMEAGSRNIITGFYIIYGTVWPGGDIGVIRESVLKEWIEFALENDMLVFIDHQIGRFNPIDQFRTLLPWLSYPNVHLALDPEWRTPIPMQEVGHLTAAEINEIQQVMEDYMIANNIPGERLFVIHQFNPTMIRNRTEVRADFAKVRLVLNISGWGPPRIKRDTYAYGALATNIPVKGFKLWYEGLPGVHYDNPLMSPREVLELNPRPYVIMYQ